MSPMETQSKTARLVPLDEGGIGKVVGRRRSIDPLSLTGHTKERARAWSRALPLGIPRGVFRFNTFEEADEWMMSHTRTPRKAN